MVLRTTISMKKVFTSGCIISLPASEVFDFLCHPKNFHHFMPSIHKAEWEDESPLEIGKAYVETRRAFGKSVTARVFISRLQAPCQIAYKSTGAGVNGEYVYTLKEVNGITKIILEAYAEGSAFGKLLLPVFVHTMKNSDAAQLIRMRNFLERS